MENKKYWEQRLSMDRDDNITKIKYLLQVGLFIKEDYEMFSSYNIEFVKELATEKTYIMVEDVRYAVSSLEEADEFIRKYIYPTLSKSCRNNSRVKAYFDTDWATIVNNHIQLSEYDMEIKLAELGV